MTEETDRSSKLKSAVAAAKKGLGGDKEQADGPTSATTESTGPVDKVKAALAKVSKAVTGLVKKDDKDDAGDGKDAAAAHKHDQSENSRKMKAAVEAARQEQNGN